VPGGFDPEHRAGDEGVVGIREGSKGFGSVDYWGGCLGVDS